MTSSLLAAVSSLAQTRTSGNIDSLLCPGGYAAIGHPYLSFKLTKENNVVDNQAVTGKVVFINFWFEGCHPCMAEMEALNELFIKMKGNKDFVFISLSWDDQQTIKKVKEKYSLSFDVLSATPEECKRLNFGCAYPTSIILDKAGIVKYRHSGGSIEKEQAQKFIMTTLLAEIQSLL